MTVFISYARANQDIAAQLRGDVERCHREVWFDRELTGGQEWWRTILHHIRGCDVFMVALSPEWVQSKACDLELRYALLLKRPVLPVMVAKIDPRLAPPAIANAQILDYLRRSPETTFALRDALDTLPNAPPLPLPLPPEPPAPISYLHNVIVALNAPMLEPNTQYWLWQQLQAALHDADEDERVGVLKLVRRLRKRRDLVPQLYPVLDAVLGAANTPTAPLTYSATWTAPTPLPPRPAYRPPTPDRSRQQLGWAWAGVAITVLMVTALVWFAAVVGDDNGSAGETTISETTTTTVDELTNTTDDDHPTLETTKKSPTTDLPCEFTMPDLTGSHTKEAETTLRDKHWIGDIDPRTSNVNEEDDADKILDQYPKPHKEVKCDADVTVTVGEYEPDPESSSSS